MRNSIDSLLLMKVFTRVEQQGEAVQTAFGPGYSLAGMQVASGFDGYDLYFHADGVTVSLGFHQKYHVDAANEAQIDAFVARLQRIGGGE
jgi:hypothetical protein